jgi:hypothetical protein
MSNPMVPIVDGRETDLEKFAELIVRECCDAADDWYQNHNDIHWDPAQHIKNCFGIE